ncbi:GPI inositol deacylase [Blyttiomyces sp. JEL0837]|nr:GPI inositol deacylase [Blyttiomyces sp. JEL0837]
MTYMYPDYVEIPMNQSNLAKSGKSRLSHKYSLWLYKERGGQSADWTNEPQGTPVLFLPGNAGSSRQVRSLGSVAADYSRLHNLPKLDFFTVEINDEFTAFDVSLILEQAEYVNGAIDHILSMYRGRSLVPPASVIIIAHSMGGIVARTIYALPSYQNRTVNTIITLATPHFAPPMPADKSMCQLFSGIDKFWKSHIGKVGSALANVVLISIAGGNRDTLIQSNYAEVDRFLPSTNGFAVYSTIESLYRILDSRADMRTGSVSSRIRAFKESFENPWDLVAQHPAREEPTTFPLHFAAKSVEIGKPKPGLSRINEIEHGALSAWELSRPNVTHLKILTNGNDKFLYCHRLGTDGETVACSELDSKMYSVPVEAPSSGAGASDKVWRYLEVTGSSQSKFDGKYLMVKGDGQPKATTWLELAAEQLVVSSNVGPIGLYQSRILSTSSI